MSDLTRFSVSVPKDLLEAFDRQIAQEHYTTRSKAVADLIRDCLVKQEWKAGSTVAGVVTLVYDHHGHGLTHKLMHVQHDFHHLIISTQHVHLDHHNCLEIIIVKGKPKDVEDLAHKLKSIKGVKHGSLSMATTGKEL